MSNLTQQINQVAQACCYKMTKVQRDEFLRYQKERKEAGLCLAKKYDPGTRYYKGARKGQIRDVFEINGDQFNKLWQLLTPYACVSVRNSRLAKDDEDFQDIVCDIKALSFRTLRFFGGSPYNKSFSEVYRSVVLNVLTNTARLRGRTSDYGTGASTRTLFGAISLSTPVNSDDPSGSVTLESHLASHEFVNTIDLAVDIPVRWREVVCQILGGATVPEVARKRGYKTQSGIQRFRNQLQAELGEVLQVPV